MGNDRNSGEAEQEGRGGGRWIGQVGGFSLYQFAELALDGGSFLGGGDEEWLRGCLGSGRLWSMGFKQLVV